MIGHERKVSETNIAASEPLVGITVLNYCGAQKSIACLESLSRTEYPNIRVVVVDNASGDGSADLIAQIRPDLDLVRSDQNLGYAGGNALGVARCLEWGAEYIWVLNNDTLVLPDTLGKMVREAQASPRIGAVGCVIRDERAPSSILALGGGRISPLLGLARHVTNREEGHRLDFLTGACMLIPTPVIRELGFISPDYFLYWEDVDYCYRLIRHGYKLVVALDATIFHDESSTLGKSSDLLTYYSFRSMVKFFYLNYPRSWIVIIILSSILRLIRRSSRLEFHYCYALIQGIYNGIGSRKSVLEPIRF